MMLRTRKPENKRLRRGRVRGIRGARGSDLETAMTCNPLKPPATPFYYAMP